jgi:BirA family biotin operon repressor/biotin-[acetyl-CoA-carboxylase] ligase
LYWSVGYPVKQTPAPILSLAIAAALCSELRTLGYGAVSVKWPNDLVANGAKLGGILVETLANGRNRWVVVIGVGINHATPVAAEQPADRPMIGLTELPVAKPPPAAIDHDALIGRLASTALDTLALPAAQLADSLHARWPDLDALSGRPITLAQPNGDVVSGTAQGIAMDGGLRVLTADGPQTFYSGESRVMTGWQATEGLLS